MRELCWCSAWVLQVKAYLLETTVAADSFLLSAFVEAFNFAEGGNSLSDYSFSVILFICLYQQTSTPAEAG